MKAVKFLLAFCIAVFLANSVIVFGQTKTEIKPVNDEIVTTPTPIAEVQNPFKNQKDEKYRIGFQDTLEIQVYRNSRLELSQNVNINPDGTILLPRIDRPIVAVCKTERQLANILIDYYKVYLKNPFVNVRSIDQRSQPFAVVGAVEKPGSFYLNRKIRLLELLAFAGGPDVENAGSKIQVARVGNITGCADEKAETNETEEFEFLGYKLNDVLSGKSNPWMQPGDIVSVLIAEEAYVVGNVVKQTKIILREEKTLTQALAEAGGANPTAKTDKIIIQRQEPGSNFKTELTFNLKDIREQKIPDPKLQGNDIIQVDTDKFKSFKKGFTEIIKGAIPSAIYRIP